MIREMTPERLEQLTKHDFARRNQQIADWLWRLQGLSILEVAAGCYDLVNRVRTTPYVWTDGDKRCVELCRPHLPENVLGLHLTAEELIRSRWPSLFGGLICVSMEHLECDIDLVKATRPGTRLFLCSSTKGSVPWHVRSHANVNEMLERYATWVDPIQTAHIGSMLLLWGVRRFSV